MSHYNTQTSELEYVNHNVITPSLCTRNINDNIEIVHDNIPEKPRIYMHVLISILFAYCIINTFLYYNIHEKIRSLQSSVDIIETEQLYRTDRVYNRTKDRFYRQDFKDWIKLFQEKNSDLAVPKIPDTSPYE